MSLIAAVASLLLVTPTFGELPLRVRGTIIAKDDRHITIKERDGRVFQLNSSPTTKYAKVVASNLGAIKLNTYIGSAIKGSLDASTAIEIAIVPQSMRPGRTGYYLWDPLPDISLIPTSRDAISIAPSTLTETDMTNGIVTANDKEAGGRRLTVNLVGNQTAHIFVSPSVPIVQFVPSHRAAIRMGSGVIVWTLPGGEARLVAVGVGIVPPM